MTSKRPGGFGGLLAKKAKQAQQATTNRSEVKFSRKSDLPQSKETSRDELLAKLLTDESFTDVTLKGKDGVLVKTNRHVLAARSDVFNEILLGDFFEASKDTVEIGFNGSMLKAIVEYIFTDRTEMLRDAGIRELVSLTGAAMYFKLPRLCELAFNAVSQSLMYHPSLAFSVLEAYKQERLPLPKIKELAMSYLSSMQMVDASDVATLSESVLEEILKDTKLDMDEFLLFDILLLWAGPYPDPGASPHRRAVASDLVKHIHLDWIDTKLLSTKVASSGLVSQEQLMETYKTQALVAQEKNINAFKKRRCA